MKVLPRVSDLVKLMKKEKVNRQICERDLDEEELRGTEAESHSNMLSTAKNKKTTEITKFR